ncbi:hypothetical protein [Streptomyces sp. AC495_CC817]|uniref:hypothetical protein n=1 Tax=Streptomyces sp. AC495_CC817 TaxID=2823900 RepID=UPI001C25AAA6|nr:hypothetical protein [Streptomyces sp. AC495_CC817]
MTRPLNPAEPYYEWDITEPDGDGSGSTNRPRGLTIYSECCADRFSDSEELVLLVALAERHGFTLTRN